MPRKGGAFVSHGAERGASNAGNVSANVTSRVRARLQTPFTDRDLEHLRGLDRHLAATADAFPRVVPPVLDGLLTISPRRIAVEGRHAVPLGAVRRRGRPCQASDQSRRRARLRQNANWETGVVEEVVWDECRRRDLLRNELLGRPLDRRDRLAPTRGDEVGLRDDADEGDVHDAHGHVDHPSEPEDDGLLRSRLDDLAGDASRNESCSIGSQLEPPQEVEGILLSASALPVSVCARLARPVSFVGGSPACTRLDLEGDSRGATPRGRLRLGFQMGLASSARASTPAPVPSVPGRSVPRTMLRLASWGPDERDRQSFDRPSSRTSCRSGSVRATRRSSRSDVRARPSRFPG